MKTDDDERIGDVSEWSSDDISLLWAELDRLRLKARQEGWEAEFLDNVREWTASHDEYPVESLRLRRKEWKKKTVQMSSKE